MHRWPWLESPSKALPKAQKEGDGNDQTEENNKIVEPSQAPQYFKEGGQVTQEELQEVTGWRATTHHHQCEMSLKENETYVEFLNQKRDVFTLTYSKMSSLDLVVATDHLAIELDKRPVKQAPTCMHSDLATKVEAEVDKLVSDGFMGEV